MTDQAAHLRAILEVPADDAPRLVYADWLDEHAGDVPCEKCDGKGWLRPYGPHHCLACDSGRVSNGFAARAEFIRVQCRLARTPWTSKDMIRSSQLLDAHGKAWFNPPGFTSWPRVEWRRGFPRAVDCSTVDFVAHAPTLFAVEPIIEVRLTDRRPMRDVAGRWGWTNDDESVGEPFYLPDRVAEHLPRGDVKVGPYRAWLTSDAALAALSRACIAYGRSVARGHTHRITCPACSGEGCATHGHGDTADRCWGAGYIERPGLPPIDLTAERVKIPSPAA